ncbi:MAG: PspC domain-containing protein [Bryobacterales bacterium]|nr:PspC domain-containing protein [Bryobacterales bacterium]
MFCTKCGRELKEDEKFCPGCGKVADPNVEPPPPVRKRLSRPMHQKKVAGVCAGFANYLNLDVTLVRIVWLLVALVAGTGFIAYLVAWIAMPADYSQVEGRQQASTA